VACRALTLIQITPGILPCMLLPVLTLALATAAACSPNVLRKDAASAAHEAQGKLGVSAHILEAQQSFSFHGGHGFPMQSVYKLPIAITTLHRVEDGRLKLDQVVQVRPEELIPPAGHSPLRDRHPKGGDFTLQDLLQRAIVDSDGSASDVLLRVLGGTKEVRHYMKDAGIKQVHVKHTEAQIIDDTHAQYADSAEPDAMVDLLARVQQGKLLNAAHTSLLLGWMKQTETGRDRIRAKLPAGTEVADKTGSSGTHEGITPATNDVGIVTLPNGQHLAMAIFLSDAKANTTTRNAVIADIAHEIWECWSIPIGEHEP
jgi:beta-lactamase class A